MTSTRPSRSEIWLTWGLLAFTLLSTVMYAAGMLDVLLGIHGWWHGVEASVFVLAVAYLLYGNVGYSLTRLGHLERLIAHRPPKPEDLLAIHDRPAPPLHVLVPSYKEELRTVQYTLMSAALQDYPGRRVTLLIDDPYKFDDQEAVKALVAVRGLVQRMDQQFRDMAAPFLRADVAFVARMASERCHLSGEIAVMASLYDEAASVLRRLAAETVCQDHTDRFFIDRILLAPAADHAERAAFWRKGRPGPDTIEQLRREHARLASLFDVAIGSFERKAYVNLSHESNKAMNLNTFMGLIGGSYREVHGDQGCLLMPALPREADLVVPEAEFLITLDADSHLLPGYAVRLIDVMQKPGNERVAVAQTPYSALPGPAGELERIAGATTDIQYIVHQGFTRYGATFWVGANAVLRRRAIEELAVTVQERGYPIKRYIQDRTVIEDTESTVELLAKGWTLYNLPERLAYSATPPDFGALTVQRGRWANGGLIIFPKLMRHLMRRAFDARAWAEGFFRIHYLTSIAGVNLGMLLLLLYPFPDAFQSWWLPAMALPYYVLYARDLKAQGYRGKLDLLRVCALNMLLVPINIGGVLRSLHQGLQGHKIPFMRTPKIAGRTRIPARYVVAQFLAVAVCVGLAVADITLARWAHAVLTLGNALLLIYGIGLFIGWREAWSDVWAGRSLGQPLAWLGLDWSRDDAKE